MIAFTDLYVFVFMSIALAGFRIYTSKTSHDARFWAGVFSGFAGMAFYLFIKQLIGIS